MFDDFPEERTKRKEIIILKYQCYHKWCWEHINVLKHIKAHDSKAQTALNDQQMNLFSLEKKRKNRKKKEYTFHHLIVRILQISIEIYFWFIKSRNDILQLFNKMI